MVTLPRPAEKGSRKASAQGQVMRGAKLKYEKFALIDEWARVTGRPVREWWDAARAGGMTGGQGEAHTRRINAWLKEAIQQERD